MFKYLARNSLFRMWFGDFQEEELRKFAYLGIIFAFVIGVYWTLRPMKDGIFGTLVIGKVNSAVDKSYLLAWAKIVSVILLFPIVMLYGKAVEKFPRHHMFYFLGLIYSVLTALFGLYFYYSPYGLFNTEGNIYRYAGWLWYVFVESYGSLMVALFWAFASDITTPDSAKRGFALAVMLGQLGAVVGPWGLTSLPTRGVFANEAPVVLICAILILMIIVGIKYFMSVMPKEQLVGFHGVNEEKLEKDEEHEPGFFEGLKLMLSYKYLLGIFGIIALFEILGTIIDFNFKSAVFAAFEPGPERSKYLGDYAGWVNLISFFCLLFGINNIQRYFGVRFSLALMPFIIVAMVLTFLVYRNVAVLFWIMVLVKAINYALNSPTMKQLYIPTTKDVKYKSQAWIETFGSRSSKATASIFNIFAKKMGSSAGLFTAALSVILGGSWLLIALYLGTKYQKAVDEKKVVC